jgi:hypothetical protein
VVLGDIANVSEADAAPIFRVEAHIYKATHQPTYFDPEDGGSMYF